MIRDRTNLRQDEGAAAALRPRVVVVGGGVAGLAAVWRLTVLAPGAEIILLEAERRLGGKIRSERTGGFVLEGGPEALLAAKPRGIVLCQELGLGDRLIGANQGAGYVLRRGQLVPLPGGLMAPVPTNLAAIAHSPALGLGGKLRMGLDYLLPPQRNDRDESVAAFVERRLGRQMHERLVEPLVGSIYAGDSRRLSVDATFPHFHRFEREHGGVIKGVLAARRSRSNGGAGGGPSSPFVAPRTGLAELTEALEHQIRAAHVRVVTGARVTRIDRRDEAPGYVVACRCGEVLRADVVICAAPAHAAARLLMGLDDGLAMRLGRIPYASVATVSLAFPLTAIPCPLDGHGYVVPQSERRALRACAWTSSKWPDRAPSGYVLIRALLGGVGHEDVLTSSDDDLVRVVRDELRDVLGIDADPTLHRVFRWPRAMPQYEVGHLERVAEIEQCLTAHPGLCLAGNAYRGVAIADCIRSGEEAADRVAAVICPSSEIPVS